MAISPGGGVVRKSLTALCWRESCNENQLCYEAIPPLAKTCIMRKIILQGRPLQRGQIKACPANVKIVMAGHRGLKDGVASLAFGPGHHDS